MMTSIGQAVDRLKKDFPNLSISKVRYLEDEGLLKPKRSKGGYRVFSEEDIGRLTEILRLQSEQFLPLAVIRERLSGWQYGSAETFEAQSPDGDWELKEDREPVSLEDLFSKAGIGMETVRALETYGLIKTIELDAGPGLDQEDIDVLKVFGKLEKFGIEARHLRIYENLAQRESLLFQQILTPQIKHKSQKLRQKSREDLKELVELTEAFRRCLLKKSLKKANLV